jgi:membrane glycosyltransferase
MTLPPLPLERVLLDWRSARARAAAYLAALGARPESLAWLARRAVERAIRAPSCASEATRETMDALEEVLLETWPVPGVPDPAARFECWRLAAWRSGGVPEREGAPLSPPRALRLAPPLRRGSMPTARLRVRGRGAGAASPEAAARRAARRRWSLAASARRPLLALLVLIPSAIAAGFMFQVLPYHGRTGLELAIALGFGALFGWISIGFWTAVCGFLVLLGGDRFAIGRSPAEAPDAPLDPGARAAIVMPIYEEPVDRVFAGLRAIRRSLERAGALERFDLFVLSDSVEPATWADEEQAWASWWREAGEGAGIFYRRRKVRRKRKSGNVADFCRRWGRSYRYMVVLDADSVMTGEALLRLLHLMERNPQVGIIQTAPVAVRARSLFARAQQFAARAYGPMFAAGMHFWQLGDAPYWGHNAIIRVEAFMAHCGLPRLSGRPPLGGDIMSHDFVEAALLGRAGWSLWLAYDLPGSYEESPSSLLEEMERDQRWCQGNLQHLRLLFTEGLYSAHRALFLNGIFSYVSAVLWLVFLVLSTVKTILGALREPDYFPSGPSLFPEWPVWHPDWVFTLLGVTAIILFAPKLLAALLILFQRGGAAGFGGRIALLRSIALEIVWSALFAPIRMVFYCRFVLLNLVGQAVTWGTGHGKGATSWGEALRRHGVDAAVAVAWAATVYMLNPDYFWWLTPVAGALVLSVPLSALASREDLGRRARERGLFATPEEVSPPAEVLDLEADLARRARERAARPAAARDGFVRAVFDPGENALHCALRGGPRSLAPSIRAAREALVQRARAEGPAALDAGARRLILSDRDCLRALHRAVWRIEAPQGARPWAVAPP